MKKITFLTIVFSFVLFDVSSAQKLKCNPELKYEISKSFTQYYCGMANGSNYTISLRDNSLIEYPANSMPISTPLTYGQSQKDEMSEFIGAYLANDQINVVYKVFKTKVKVTGFAIYVDTYDLKGSKKNRTEIFNIPEKEISLMEANALMRTPNRQAYDQAYNIIVNVSNTKNYMSMRYKDEIFVFDTKDLKKIKTINLSDPVTDYKTVTINYLHTLLDNGDVITIENVFDDYFSYGIVDDNSGA